jgi:hypothetical protein
MHQLHSGRLAPCCWRDFCPRPIFGSFNSPFCRMIIRNISCGELGRNPLLKQIDNAEIIDNDRTAATASPALEISAGLWTLRVSRSEDAIFPGGTVTVGFYRLPAARLCSYKDVYAFHSATRHSVPLSLSVRRDQGFQIHLLRANWK